MSLVLEFIDLERGIAQIDRILKRRGHFCAVIQTNKNESELITASDSPSINRLAGIHRVVYVDKVIRSFRKIGYDLAIRVDLDVPNQKTLTLVSMRKTPERAGGDLPAKAGL